MDRVRVGTVGRFQGQEARLVIFITTCSRTSEPPGHTRPSFLADACRLCVAMIRHVELLIVVGDQTLIRLVARRPHDGGYEERGARDRLGAIRQAWTFFSDNGLLASSVGDKIRRANARLYNTRGMLTSSSSTR